MRNLYLFAFAALFVACVQSAQAQGYDPNQMYGGQPGYQQPQAGYQPYNGLPQTTPNYGQQYGNYGAPATPGYVAQPQYGQQQSYGQPPQLQQQYAQYGQMPQSPTYYGQAQQTQQPSWPNNAGNSAGGGMDSQPQNSPGSYLNQKDNELPDLPDTPDNTVHEQPSGGGHGGAMVKGAAGLLGKVVGKAATVAAPAASIYMMNKASGGRMRYYMPAPSIPVPGMGNMYGGYNPYMGAGMRSFTGW